MFRQRQVREEHHRPDRRIGWSPASGSRQRGRGEREAISRRTREVLAAARARGVRLGNPNGAASLRRAGKGGTALRASDTANADAFAADLAGVVADIRAAGHVTLRAIAAELTARRIRTRRGGEWQVSNVRGLLDRIGMDAPGGNRP